MGVLDDLIYKLEYFGVHRCGIIVFTRLTNSTEYKKPPHSKKKFNGKKKKLKGEVLSIFFQVAFNGNIWN